MDIYTIRNSAHGFHATPSGGPSIPESATVLRSAVSGFDDPPALLLAVGSAAPRLIALVLALTRSARPSARRRAGTSGPQVLAVPAGLLSTCRRCPEKGKGGHFLWSCLPLHPRLTISPQGRATTFDARACGMAQPRQTNGISDAPSPSAANSIAPLQHLPIPHPSQKSDTANSDRLPNRTTTIDNGTTPMGGNREEF